MRNPLHDHLNMNNIYLNFGPQHPAAHGVLRLVLELNGEIVVRCDPHIGLLHRGTEKLLEGKFVKQGLPYFDRLDYVSTLAQEHVYSMAIEAIGNIQLPERAKYLRIICVEFTRILNHLMAVTTHALDLGALTPFLWAFEEREKMMEFYERLSGARLHTAYIRPGGVKADIPALMLQDIFTFCKQFIKRINELEEILSGNSIWKQRLIEVGSVSTQEALTSGLTGVMLRSTGIPWDLRLTAPYENYNKFDFHIPVGRNGDCFDRYLIRIEEMRQSLEIILQALNSIPTGDHKINNWKIHTFERTKMKTHMENLIHHFITFMKDSPLKTAYSYVAIEAPKGETSVFLDIGPLNLPSRCHIKSPGLLNLAALDRMASGHSLADLVAIIGTQDLVLGEIDR